MQDRLISTLLQTYSLSVNEVCFNIAFYSIYKNSSEIGKDQLKNEFSKELITGNKMVHALGALMIDRLAQEGSVNQGANLGLHGQHKLVNTKKYDAIKQGFKSFPLEVNSVDDLIGYIEKGFNSRNLPITKSMQEYWQNLTKRSLVTQESLPSAVATARS
jgi:hypothetical protein